MATEPLSVMIPIGTNGQQRLTMATIGDQCGCWRKISECVQEYLEGKAGKQTYCTYVDIQKFNIRYLVMYKVQMHTGAIS